MGSHRDNGKGVVCTLASCCSGIHDRMQRYDGMPVAHRFAVLTVPAWPDRYVVRVFLISYVSEDVTSERVCEETILSG